ncbi:MAG: hypothetical protein KDA28_13370, partial [Phycisphaerales bacterium]|nr:hypothetical protein [Phycisphaerales bacterium]
LVGRQAFGTQGELAQASADAARREVELSHANQTIAALEGDLETSRSQAQTLSRTVESQRERIGTLEETVRTKDLEITKRNLWLQRSIAEHRVLQIRDVDTTTHPGFVRFRFVEIGPDDSPVRPPVEHEIKGTEIGIDYFVVQWRDDLVREGLPGARTSQSICLLRGIVGRERAIREELEDLQRKADWLAVDAPGLPPVILRQGSVVSESEGVLWRDIWDLDRDETSDVRDAGGFTVWTRPVEGYEYHVHIRAAGPPEVREIRASAGG